MCSERGHVAVSTLTVWVAYVAFFYLDLFTTELIDRNVELKDSDKSIHYWTFMGTIGMLMAFWMIIDLIGLVDLDSRYTSLQKSLYSLLFYVAFTNMGFYHPFSKFRELQLAEDGLMGVRPYSIGCMRSTTRNLSLPANESYFTLEDPEWTVDWNRSKNHDEWGWSHTVAPIVYNGPVVGCQFDPPLWAVCVVKGSSMEACGFNESKIGEYTSMRKFHSIHYMDTEEKQKLQELVSADYLVEFNSPTMYDVLQEMAVIEDEKAKMWFLSLASYGGVTFLVVIVLNIYNSLRDATDDENSVSGSEDEEMRQCEAVCKQHRSITLRIAITCLFPPTFLTECCAVFPTCREIYPTLSFFFFVLHFLPRPLTHRLQTRC